MLRRTAALRLPALIAASILALTVAGCGGGSSSQGTPGGQQPFRVLYVSGITGFLSPSAKAVQRGVKAAVAQINDTGGLHGRMVELTTKDNQSEPTRGVTLVQQALHSDTPPNLVIPGVSSNEALAVAPLLSRAEVIGISPASNAVLNNPEKYPYFFSQAALQKDILQIAAKFLEQRGANQVAVVTPDDALGDAIVGPLKETLGELGIEFSSYQFPPDSLDYTPTFRKAVNSNPDWIFMDASGAQVPRLLSARIKAGGKDVPTIAGVVATSQPLVELTRGTDQLDNVYLTLLPTQSFVPDDQRSQVFNNFFERIRAQGPIKVSLSTYSAGWASVMLWADAVRQIDGEVTPQKVRDSLIHLPTKGERLMYERTYTEESNFVNPKQGEITITEVSGVRNGMYVPAE